MNEDIKSAIATTILFIGLAILIPAIAKSVAEARPSIHLEIRLDIY
ncbi:hypothetical protein [Iningainema tapete]|uniref:Uncharacterized protein n=1 Tax=Iningainema tapete BLCC-T55 TaxID=2748662 RepID=A0A8J6XEJ7_9CYAN|nr:hypothetical protein [Iningainema tapete]MBD2770966.1 hypothetical protein [Iningainema tapete BLCC-T55]